LLALLSRNASIRTEQWHDGRNTCLHIDTFSRIADFRELGVKLLHLSDLCIWPESGDIGTVIDALGSPDFISSLHLDDSQIHDADLKLLRPWVNLQFLSMDRCAQLTGTGFNHLDVLLKLSELRLGHTSVTDSGLAGVAKLPSIASLRLWNTAITDVGVESIARMRSLRSLWLCRTRVTDACLEMLATLPRLEFLDVNETSVTESGWDAFKQNRPDVRTSIYL